jgi:hypothetical protein
VSPRTIYLVFLIELLYEAYLGDIAKRECTGLVSSPLPCVRDLWDSETDESWPRRLQRSFTGRTASGRVLTVGDLRRSCVAEEQSASGESMGVELAKWSQNLDEFGTLVWMCVSLTIGKTAKNTMAT